MAKKAASNKAEVKPREPAADRPLHQPVDWAELHYGLEQGFLEDRCVASSGSFLSDLKQRFESAWDDTGAEGRHPAGRILRVEVVVSGRDLVSDGLDDAFRSLIRVLVIEGRSGCHAEMRDGVSVFGRLTTELGESILKTLREPPDSVEALVADIQTNLRAFRPRLEWLLQSLTGRSFGSFEANHRIASMLQDIANRLGVAFACQAEGCGMPAKIRCRKTQRMTTGAFQFEHATESGMTSHCGTAALPRLQIVEPPPDRRKRVSEESQEKS